MVEGQLIKKVQARFLQVLSFSSGAWDLEPLFLITPPEAPRGLKSLAGFLR